MLISMKCLLDLVFHDLFPVVGCLLQAYQLFLIAHQQFWFLQVRKALRVGVISKYLGM